MLKIINNTYKSIDINQVDDFIYLSMVLTRLMYRRVNMHMWEYDKAVLEEYFAKKVWGYETSATISLFDIDGDGNVLLDPN